jgi:enoyl-CoA hydratase/carnithine racemase
MWLCLTGETIDAEEARRIGMINEVQPHDECLARAEELASMLCRNSPALMKLEKELLLRSLDQPRSEMLRFSWLMHFVQRYSHDAAEGVAAFGEKREPAYRGW